MRAGAAGSPGRPPATPPSSLGRCSQNARGEFSSEVKSEETHWTHARESSHRKDPHTKVTTSSKGAHRGYQELASKQRSGGGEERGRAGRSPRPQLPTQLAVQPEAPVWSGLPVGSLAGLGGSVHAAEAALSSQALESLGETLQPCLLWACRGMEKLGGPSPPGALGHRWGLSGSQQSRWVGSTPPVELGPPGPETQPDSTRPPHSPRPEYMEEAPALCSSLSPGGPQAVPWAMGGSRGPGQQAVAGSAPPAPELWDPAQGTPRPRAAPERGL